MDPTQHTVGGDRNHHRPGGPSDDPHTPAIESQGCTQQLDKIAITRLELFYARLTRVLGFAASELAKVPIVRQWLFLG